jgi:hypothetical protein
LSQQGFFLQPNLISAAAATGVKRFIPSEFSANIEQAPRGTTPFWDVKLDARDQIKKTAMEYTFIETGPFMEYLFSPFIGVNIQEKSIVLFNENTQLSTIHTDDIAKLVPEILLHPKSKNSTIRLGAEVFKWNDAVDKLEKLTGKIFNYSRIPPFLSLPLPLSPSLSLSLSLSLIIYIGTTWSKKQLRLEELEKVISSATDPVVGFVAVVHKQYMLHGGALSPLANLEDPYYAHVKTTKVDEYLQQILK